MDRIRPETEVDRIQAALAARALTLPLSSRDVEITVNRRAAESAAGQRLLVLLVNELARMKGVTGRLHVVGVPAECAVEPGVPVEGADLQAGLASLVDGLNAATSAFRADIAFEPCAEAAAVVNIGDSAGHGLRLGADGWRALVGDAASDSLWNASPPYGAALAAALGAAEVFKALLNANGAADPNRRALTNFAFSAYNFGTGSNALAGPDVTSVRLEDMAIIGCGAGGSAVLYVLAMQPGLSGQVALVEPGRHKLSNLNRYLMTTANDVHDGRLKLATAAHHLAVLAPDLRPILVPQPWELVTSPPWPLLVSTVDTIEARWAIQDRSPSNATILDGAVLDMLYVLLRVQPGGRCLECAHPYDPELPLKQRASRWGVDLDTVRYWTQHDVPVSAAMIQQLARTQNQPAESFAVLEGVLFSETPRMLECGATRLRADVPSQAPILPIATTPVGALLAAEVVKSVAAPEASLSNWLGHDLGRAPDAPRARWRPAVSTCPRHA